MRKVTALFAASIIAIGLSGCGNANDDKTTPKENTSGSSTQKKDSNDRPADHTSNKARSQQDMKDKMDQLSYSEYEVEAKYSGDKDYEAEIEHDDKTGDITSSLKDGLNNIKLQGKESFNKVYPGLEKLTIDGTTEKNDAISQVLKAFDLPEDYEKIEISLNTAEGKKIEFEDHK